MLLSEYRPFSELIVKETEYNKPCHPVIDFHTHFGPVYRGQRYEKTYTAKNIISILKSYGVEKVIDLEIFPEEVEHVCRIWEGQEEFCTIFAPINFDYINEPNFETYVHKTIQRYKKLGIKGLKVWKNLGLEYKDKNGKLLRADDKRLQVIWQEAEENHFPVVVHLADPPAFFKPIDNNNERVEELIEHPEWCFYGKGLPSFEELLEQQDKLIGNNPNTTFVVAHCGSHAENLNFVSEQLNKHPNMYIDISARISELGRQPYTAKKFFTKHQDRILFGTDYYPTKDLLYPIYYRFLESMDEYFNYDYNIIPAKGRWKIYGIGLEPDILRKIYHDNAEYLLTRL